MARSDFAGAGRGLRTHTSDEDGRRGQRETVQFNGILGRWRRLQIDHSFAWMDVDLEGDADKVQ